MAGEFDLIDWIRGQSGMNSPRVVIPSGDDLAALSWDARDLVLVGVDQVLDGVHFDSAIHSPRQIGAKVVNRNLSDCAAMACLPAAAVATVALPRGTPIEYAQDLYRGMRDAADPFDCPIVGGDVATWAGKLLVTVTILGRSAGIDPVRRTGARAGDGIYVTGPLGGSLLGRHLTFSPRVALGRELAKTGKVTAMIDISDGLSRDLGHICRDSGVGAVVRAVDVPIHADAIAMSARDRRSPLEHALHDGEDHELLLTASEPLPGAIRIGEIVAGSGILLEETAGQRTPLRTGGWEHQL